MTALDTRFTAAASSGQAPPRPDPARFARLTKRHRECLAYVRQLMGSKEIAERLGIEKSTVDGYLTEAVRLIGARNRRDAALLLEAHEREMQGETAPDKIGGHSARLVPAPEIPPSDVSPDEGFVGQAAIPDERPTRSRGFRLPYRRKGQADNDLSVGERLIWIQVIAVGSAIGFGMLATGLQVVTEVIESIVRHSS